LGALAVLNGPALDAQSELDVQNGLVVRGAYFRPGNRARASAAARRSLARDIRDGSKHRAPPSAAQLSNM